MTSGHTKNSIIFFLRITHDQRNKCDHGDTIQSIRVTGLTGEEGRNSAYGFEQSIAVPCTLEYQL